MVGSCYLFLIQTKFKDFVEMCTDLFLVHDLDANHRHLAYFNNKLTCDGEHFFCSVHFSVRSFPTESAVVVKTHVRYAFLFSIMSQVFSTVGSKQHTLTGELTKSAANKKSHLPSRGVRCDRGGRVRAQAPGETQQKMETANKKKKTEKESKREETEQKTNDHMKIKSQTEKRPTLPQRKQHYSASALHLHYQTVLSMFHQF